MRSRSVILATLLLMTMVIMFGSVSERDRAQAATYGCKNSQCPNTATCDGDHWTRTGECTISCYKDSGTTGEIVFSGSANCGTSSSGGGGTGGGLGGVGSEGGGCWSSWDCFAGETCDQSTGTCQQYDGGFAGLGG